LFFLVIFFLFMDGREPMNFSLTIDNSTVVYRPAFLREFFFFFFILHVNFYLLISVLRLVFSVFFQFFSFSVCLVGPGPHNEAISRHCGNKPI